MSENLAPVPDVAVDIDNLISPDTEQPPGEKNDLATSPQQATVDSLLPVPASTTDMESILLETGSMTGSIDLSMSTDNLLLQSKSSDSLLLEGVADIMGQSESVSKEGVRVQESEQDDDTMAKTSSVSGVSEAASSKSSFQIGSDDEDSIKDEKPTFDKEIPKNNDITKYFAPDTSEDPFDKLSPLHKRKVSIELPPKSKDAQSDATSVAFEEVKGDGSIKPAYSRQSLTKFFTEDSGSSDAEGKSFFDTFTAGEEDAQNSPSVAVPSTPPVGNILSTSPMPAPPFQVTPTPSPLHSTSTPPACNTKQHPLGVTPQVSEEHSKSDLGEQTIEITDDVFSSSLNLSDTDRRHDAWIPSELTRQTLQTLKTNPTTFVPEQSMLTTPGLVVDDPQGDPIQEMIHRQLGDSEASTRDRLTVKDVTQDDEGLRKLIANEAYRSAVDLTGVLLTQCGQGADKLGQHSKKTPFSLQLWFTRLALLIKLRQYSHAESECQAFGNLDNPDLYYEFYHDTYPGRKGSMVPFDFRIVHAELPQYLGKSQESLDRFYYIHAIIEQILKNLCEGLLEDGGMGEMSTESRKAAVELWQNREVQILMAIGNCLVNIKDYETAVIIYEDILDKGVTTDELYCGLARLYLQMGDVKSAQKYFNRIDENIDSKDPQIKYRNALNKGLVALGENKFKEAMDLFSEAYEADSNSAVALNNKAVCALYMGQLKESLEIIENLVHNEPAKHLQEGVLFNLSTLYELESSKANAKKQDLLKLVGQYKNDGFNVACLKMM